MCYVKSMVCNKSGRCVPSEVWFAIRLVDVFCQKYGWQ